MPCATSAAERYSRSGSSVIGTRVLYSGRRAQRGKETARVSSSSSGGGGGDGSGETAREPFFRAKMVMTSRTDVTNEAACSQQPGTFVYRPASYSHAWTTPVAAA